MGGEGGLGRACALRNSLRGNARTQSELEVPPFKPPRGMAARATYHPPNRGLSGKKRVKKAHVIVYSRFKLLCVNLKTGQLYQFRGTFGSAVLESPLLSSLEGRGLVKR